MFQLVGLSLVLHQAICPNSYLWIVGDLIEVVALYKNNKALKDAMGIFMAYAHITDFKLDGTPLTPSKQDDPESDEEDHTKRLEVTMTVGFVVVGCLLFALLGLVVWVLVLNVRFRKQGGRGFVSTTPPPLSHTHYHTHTLHTHTHTITLYHTLSHSITDTVLLLIDVFLSDRVGDT